MPTLRSRRQASASRICEGSLYIDLRLTRAMPARWPPPCAAPASSTFQDLFGACRVRLPLFASEKPGVLIVTPAAPGPGMCWLSAGSVRHTSSRPPGGAPAGLVRTPDCCGKPVTWNMYMLAAKNSSLACAVCASTVVLMHPPGWLRLAGARHCRACRDPLPVRGTLGRADTPPGPVVGAGAGGCRGSAPAKPAPGTPAPARWPLARLVAGIVLCLAAVVAVVSLFVHRPGLIPRPLAFCPVSPRPMQRWALHTIS